MERSEQEEKQSLFSNVKDFTVDEDYARLPARKADAHKGDFGRVLIIAGSVGYTGAPALAARAAVRMGSGLVFLGVMSYVLVGRHQKKKRYEGYKRRFEEELRQEALARERRKR